LYPPTISPPPMSKSAWTTLPQWGTSWPKQSKYHLVYTTKFAFTMLESPGYG